jgi:hypothetical protein
LILISSRVAASALDNILKQVRDGVGKVKWVQIEQSGWQVVAIMNIYTVAASPNAVAVQMLQR